MKKTLVCFLVVFALTILICSPVLAVFVPPETSITKEENAYAEQVWSGIAWDTSRVNQYNELSLKLPKVSADYSWSVGLDTGKYVGISVNCKSIYIGHGGQDVILAINPGGNGIYVDLIHITNGGVVGSETYIYKPETGVRLIPPEERVKGAIDDNGNVVGLYDVWGKQIVNDTVYAHVVNGYLTFRDVSSSHWAYKTIYELTAMSLLNGYPDRTFKPDANMTRAEFSVVMSGLIRKLYQEEERYSNYGLFPDMKPSYWSYKDTYRMLNFMTGAEANNIFGTRFLPEKKITREEVAAVVYAILKNYPGIADRTSNTSPGKTFTDINESSFKDGINFCYNKGFMVGYPNDTFKPEGLITRAEITALFSKILKQV